MFLRCRLEIASRQQRNRGKKERYGFRIGVPYGPNPWLEKLYERSVNRTAVTWKIMVDDLLFHYKASHILKSCEPSKNIGHSVPLQLSQLLQINAEVFDQLVHCKDHLSARASQLWPTYLAKNILIQHIRSHTWVGLL